MPVSQHTSETTLNTPFDRPPSYESLMISFGMMPRDTTSDSDYTSHDTTASINRLARVRYRGQLSSRFNHLHPLRVNEEGNSPNEASSSSEQPRIELIDDVNSHGIEPLPEDRQDLPVTTGASNGRQESDELNSTTRADREHRESTTNEVTEEMSREETTSNDTNESVSNNAINSGPQWVETTTRRCVDSPHSFERTSHEGNDSLGRHSSQSNSNPSAESLSENMYVVRNISMRSSNPASMVHSNEMHNALVRGQPHPASVAGDAIRNERNITDSSPAMDGYRRPLQLTLSGSSEDNVYIDITQNLPHSSIDGNDSGRIAVRYWGQVESTSAGSIQARSRVPHERENTRADVINTPEMI